MNDDLALCDAGQAMNLANIVGLAPDDVFAVAPGDAATVGVGRFTSGEDVEVRSLGQTNSAHIDFVFGVW